jgi:hypothetical protein
LGREGESLQSFEINVDLQSLTHTRFGWMEMKITQGGEVRMRGRRREERGGGPKVKGE